MDTRTPRRRVSRAERERQILDAAVAVFRERGYQAASMDVVAEPVGRGPDEERRRDVEVLVAGT